MAHRPRTVVFDMVETLMSLQPLCSRLVEVGLPGRPLPGPAVADRIELPALARSAERDWAVNHFRDRLEVVL